MPLYHAYNALTNTRGDSLVGFRVQARVPNGGPIAPIYSDGNGTPIEVVSGIANTAITDDAGNYSFFIEANANYDLEYSTPEGVFVSATRNVPMFAGIPGEPGAPGEPGPADNTYSSYAAMQASDPTRKSARLVGDTDNPPHPDGPYNNPTQTIGGWVPQITDGLVYTLPAQAAQPQSQSDKNEQTIDVFDALTPAMRSAMRGGSYVDVGPAIDAICDFAAGAENTGTVGGVTLWMKGGRYSSSAPLRNTIRYDKQITDDGDCRRMNLCGDGSANTMFFYEGDPAIPAYSVRGYNGGNGHDLYHVIEGMRIRRQFGARGQGTGVKMQDVADVHWVDAHVDGFNLAIDVEGVLGWLAENLCILGNNGGLLARLGAGFTRPNAWQFIGGKISGNAVYGAQFTDAANIGFLGTRFEANGDGQVGSEPNKANQFVLRMLGAPAEGGAWLTLDNCYFENNNVETEVDISTSTSASATIGIRNCSFQRISNIRNPNRHIDFSATGTGRVFAHLDAVAFRSLNGRTPNAALKAWRNQTANTIITTTSPLYEVPLEGPDSGGFPLIGNTYAVMDVLVNADGTYNSDPMITTNVREIIKTGVGKYTVYFRTSPTNAASTRYTATQDGNTGPATVTFKSAGGVDVETRDVPGAAGVLVDRAFRIEGIGSFA